MKPKVLYKLHLFLLQFMSRVLLTEKSYGARIASKISRMNNHRAFAPCAPDSPARGGTDRLYSAYKSEVRYGVLLRILKMHTLLPINNTCTYFHHGGLGTAVKVLYLGHIT